VLALRLIDKEQLPCNSAAVLLQAANQFYQPFFINFPSAILPSAKKKKKKIKNKTTKNPSHLPSASLLHPVVNKVVEQQYLGRHVTLQ
jgi:hypothetical protein